MQHKTRERIITILGWVCTALFSPLLIISAIDMFIVRPIKDWVENLLVKLNNYLLKNYPDKE